MSTQLISLKLEKEIMNEIDSKIKKHRYSTRTEFIKDSIREKLKELEKDEFFIQISKFRGIAKKKTTEKEYEKNRQLAFEKIEKRLK